MLPRGSIFAVSAVSYHYTRGYNEKSTSLEVLLSGDPWGNRTPVFAVRGRCLSRLTKGPYCLADVIIA